MRLFSYVVARDFGFAPNPFFGVCTLATCKPDIRAKANVGDWLVGTGAKPNRLEGHIVYAMRVSETLTYDEYWTDRRFVEKRPNLRGSLKQAYGDNIYHRDSKTGDWLQSDSHHSFEDGSPNRENIDRDTKSDRVLVGDEFCYWGGSGPAVPVRFRNWNGVDVCKKGPSHKCDFPSSLVKSFIEWIREQRESGYIGDPAEFLLTHG